MNIASTPSLGALSTSVSASGGASAPAVSSFTELLGSTSVSAQPLGAGLTPVATLPPLLMSSALASAPVQPATGQVGAQVPITPPVAAAASSQAPLLPTQPPGLELQLPQSTALATLMADAPGETLLAEAPEAPAPPALETANQPLVIDPAAPAPGIAGPAKAIVAAPAPQVTPPKQAEPKDEAQKAAESPAVVELPKPQSGRVAAAEPVALQKVEAIPEQHPELPQQQLVQPARNPELVQQQMLEPSPNPELIQPPLTEATSDLASNSDPNLDSQPEPHQHLPEAGDIEAEAVIANPVAPERPTSTNLAASPAPSSSAPANEASAPGRGPVREQSAATQAPAAFSASSAPADRLPISEISSTASAAAPAAAPTPVSAAATGAPPAPAFAAPSFAPAAAEVAEASFSPSDQPAEPQVTARPGQIGRELGLEIARRAAAGGDELLVRLNPQEMGRIEVRMHFNEAGNLRAQVTVESAAALEMLQRDAGDLGRALADAGVRADPQSLKFDGRGSGDASSAWNRQNRDGEQRREPEHQPGFESIEAEEVAYRPVRGQGRIDLMA